MIMNNLVRFTNLEYIRTNLNGLNLNETANFEFS